MAVLLVEANNDRRDRLHHALITDAGLVVTALASGVDALALLALDDTAYKVVVTGTLKCGTNSSEISRLALRSGKPGITVLRKTQNSKTAELVEDVKRSHR